MKKHLLSAEIRTQLGKTVKLLRKQGKLPATVYGKDMESMSILMATDAFLSVYKEAGEAGLIELTVEKNAYPVLIHGVQVHAVSGAPLHVEFHKVNLKEKIHAKVAVEHTGESAAIEQKLGVLLSINDAIEVTALPTDLPEKLSVDISVLTTVGQDITASDVVLPDGVTLVTDPTTIILKIGALVTKEAEAEVAADVAQAAEAATAADEAVAKDVEEVKKEASDAK